MAEDRNESHGANIGRRTFLGALGAAAAETVLHPQPAESATGRISLYRDSFGKVTPTSAHALEAGVTPPPTEDVCAACPSDCTFVTCGYHQPNILLVMVDQLRAARWVPADWQASSFQETLPNIYALENHSFVFPNYFPAATACSPSRASLQTGLYAQQHGIFHTLSAGGNQPHVIPYALNAQTQEMVGYPTIGNVLSQPLLNGVPYDTVWIGKWHLSANNSGAGGPRSYGYSDKSYCIPNTAPNPYNSPAVNYPSPDGAANEGTEGKLLDTVTVSPSGQAFPNPGVRWTSPGGSLGDGAIADAFVNTWLPYAEATFLSPRKPWFAAVSFVNPHDISHFPYAYGLTFTDSADFGSAPRAPTQGFLIPPLTGWDPSDVTPGEYLPPLPDLYTEAPSGPSPGGDKPWNNSDNPVTQPYGIYTSSGYGKPSEQYYFQFQSDSTFGPVKTQSGWLLFLNYYLWMQSCVDYQVGRVIDALQDSAFAGNTAILFLSDHGEYGGSHYMHRKGGALYDEVINVPLYVSLPGQVTRTVIPNVCSSVDILPFLYWLALGNDSWRTNPGDLIYYLAGREAIHDFIFSSQPRQRRLSSIPNANPVGSPPYQDWQLYQPYVLHTCDEDLAAYIPNTGGPGNHPPPTPAPSHAIAFRTVDVTVNPNQQPPYGGGKLGTYSYWPSPCALSPGAPPDPSQTQPLLTNPPAAPAQEFEFYNYSPTPANGSLPPNPQEAGNQAFSDGVPTWEPQALDYYNSFMSAAVQSELNEVPPQPYIQSAYSNGTWTGTALAACLIYAQQVLGAHCSASRVP